MRGCGEGFISLRIRALFWQGGQSTGLTGGQATANTKSHISHNALPVYNKIESKYMMLNALILCCRAILGREQAGIHNGKEKNGVLGLDSAMKGYAVLGITWDNNMGFGVTMTQVQDRLLNLDPQSSMLALCYGKPKEMNGVSGLNSALYGITAPVIIWTDMCFGVIMTQVQDQSLNLLTCSPVCYHCAMATPYHTIVYHYY